MHPYLAEVVGTGILVLLGNGIVANAVLSKTKGHAAGWVAITLGWGLAVALAVYSVGRISGAHINPAVTIGLAGIGEFPWADVPGYIIAQMAGAFIGAALVWVAYLSHWKATEDTGAKLACFSTGPAIRNTKANLLTEIIGTAMLVFGVLAIGSVAQGMEQALLAEPGDAFAEGTLQSGLITGFSTWFGPLLVGLLVLSIGLSLGGPTGYAINPARDLGPRLAHAVLPIAGKGDSDWSYSWIPVVGPIIGGLLGGWLFVLLGM